MFDEIGQIIFNHEIVANASDFNMGIEVETIRVDAASKLTTEPYPKLLGDQRQNHFINLDYSPRYLGHEIASGRSESNVWSVANTD
jgi:gamma-glutamylcysteine synthetase